MNRRKQEKIVQHKRPASHPMYFRQGPHCTSIINISTINRVVEAVILTKQLSLFTFSLLGGQRINNSQSSSSRIKIYTYWHQILIKLQEAGQIFIYLIKTSQTERLKTELSDLKKSIK